MIIYLPGMSVKKQDIELTTPASVRQKFFGLKPLRDKAVISNQAQAVRYADVYDHVAELENEFNLLLTLFRSNKQKMLKDKINEEQAKALSYMLFYLAHILNNYHKHYGEIRCCTYQQVIEELELFFKKQQKESAEAHHHVLKQMALDAKNNLLGILKTCRHTSKMRDDVSKANMYRIYWIFCHFTMRQAVLCANNIKLFDKLEHVTGKKIDSQGFLKALDTPNNIFNILSVGIYALRLLIDIAMIFKHTCFPTDDEAEVAKKERFLREWNKRKWDMLNNIVWGTVNLITNYNTLFGISGALAMQLISAVLIFDVIFLQIKYHEAYVGFRKNNERLKEAIRQAKLAGDTDQAAMLEQEKQALLDDWQVTNSTYRFYTGAAILLFASFTASLLVGPAGLVLSCYLLGTLAVSMYLSGDEYGAYVKAKLELKHIQEVNQLAPKGEEQYDAATIEYYQKAVAEKRADLRNAVIGKTMLPNILLLTFLVSWQVGLCLLLILAAKKVYDNYIAENKEEEQPELEQYPLLPAPEAKA